MQHKAPVPQFQKPSGDLNERVEQITEYLALLCEHLTDLLQNLGVENINASELKKLAKQINEQTDIILKENESKSGLDVFTPKNEKLGVILYEQ